MYQIESIEIQPARMQDGTSLDLTCVPNKLGSVNITGPESCMRQ
jgi:hypothetical protein